MYSDSLTDHLEFDIEFPTDIRNEVDQIVTDSVHQSSERRITRIEAMTGLLKVVSRCDNEVSRVILGISSLLIAKNSKSAETSIMRILSSIGLDSTGPPRQLSISLYSQFICPKLEYGLGVITPTTQQQKGLEVAQNNCIIRIYAAHSHSSIAIIRICINFPQ
ncbi:hypothetical protein BDA99DRAFT_533388 [Phascolomyces articulosus]|uniref:Uncharacterized protein n=1 Tax=Phascolomyces articulosus TaxID=60185 RepID=A0AAD5PIA1_9FUNG|nr:hypothetical protein BDA99DRAFT_533388 [Phascolomyces articulosus]